MRRSAIATRTQSFGTPFTGLPRRSLLAAGSATVLAALAALAACVPATATPDVPSQASADKPLVIVDSFAGGGLDPVRDGSSLQKWMIGEPLARVTRKGDIGPWLATSWKTVEPTKWEITLRPGTKAAPQPHGSHTTVKSHSCQT